MKKIDDVSKKNEKKLSQYIGGCYYVFGYIISRIIANIFSLEVGVILFALAMIGIIIIESYGVKYSTIKITVIIIVLWFFSMIPLYYAQKNIIQPIKLNRFKDNVVEIEIIAKGEEIYYSKDKLRVMLVAEDKKDNNKDRTENIIKGKAIVKYNDGHKEDFKYIKKAGSYGCIKAKYKTYYLSDE